MAKNIALVHDFLLYWGGAERLLQGLTRVFPQATIFTLYHNTAFTNAWFDNKAIQHSFLQHWWRIHKGLLPFMPTAIESLNLTQYDVVISSGVFAKGIITKPQTIHVHYCHTPTRFLWEESREYIADNVPLGLRTFTTQLFHWLRLWDYQAAQRPDVILANSQWTKHKITKFYQREAQVVYPFVENVKHQKSNSKQTPKEFHQSDYGMTQFQVQNDYFLIVSRLQPYKNIDLAISVFNELALPLVIVGTGSDEKRLKWLAGPTVEFLGFVSEDELPMLYQNARAVILPGVEDFGLVPIEAMAQGTPVIAFGQGGAKETIIEGKTGLFFHQQTKQSLKQTIKKLLSDKQLFNRKTIMTHSKQFSFDRFKQQILRSIENAQAG